MRTRTLTVALVTAIALAAAGCGGSSGGSGDKAGNDKADAVSEAERPYVDALAKSMTEPVDDDEIVMSDKSAACVAPLFVRIIGVEKLKDNGITPEAFADDDSMDYSKLKITEKDGNALYDTFGQCDVDFRKAMVESFAADEEMTPAMAKCMESVLTDDNLRELMVTTMVKGEDAVEDSPLMGQMMGCAFLGLGEDE